MTCNGTTCRQGRKPCKTPEKCGCRGLTQCNTDGSRSHTEHDHGENSPWDWIDDLTQKVSTALLVIAAAGACMTVYAIFFT